MATGDDFRKVKLFRYPAPSPKAVFKEYKGHSEHVSGVIFTGNGKYVVSIGGLDKSILQYSVK